ncbi:MAG: Gfo/Idh/MocA family oxidoreductase [Kiritimatiellae bacterium]|nr:Gfo/Idh/MocA family oxidoreductase [Kiritimatiellia bacterium]MDD4019080.1 Gfo/Idh/MocA family oxidoreductase [Kiritimatiellia bacterium]
MIRVGIIGFGFMGRMHYRCWKSMKNARVAALCDANRQACHDTGRSHGNIAGAEGEVDLSSVTVYADPDEMLAREKLDAVSITVPTHLHAALTVKALEQGVHVLCEKPMALSPADGQWMIEAAEKSGKALQIGHCIRFWPEYSKAKEIVDGGAYGRVLTASFQRYSATAYSKKGSWFADEEKSGGMVFDLHIHDTDFVQHLFGMPAAVCSHAALTPGGGISHIFTRYQYPGGPLVTAEGGWAMTPSYGFEMKFLILMEKAVLSFSSGSSPTLKLYPAEGEVSAPRIEAGDGYSRQIEYFVKTVRGETVPIVTTPKQALNSLCIAEAERDSARKGNCINVN